MGAEEVDHAWPVVTSADQVLIVLGYGICFEGIRGCQHGR